MIPLWYNGKTPQKLPAMRKHTDNDRYVLLTQWTSTVSHFMETESRANSNGHCRLMCTGFCLVEGKVVEINIGDIYTAV
jgi:hypothetical protein